MIKSVLGILGAVLSGFFLSFSPIPKLYFDFLISLGLIMLLTGIFSRIEVEKLFRAWKRGIYIRTALIGNFVFLPALALGVSYLAFDRIDLILAFFLYLLTPCTDWFLTFTELSGGDVERNVALLPFNLVTQLIMIPFVLFFIVGRLVPIPPMAIGRVLLVYLGIPIFGGFIVRRAPLGEVAEILRREEWLWLAILGIFGSLGEEILPLAEFLPYYLSVVALYLVFVLFVSWKVGGWVFEDLPRTKALSCTMCARNSPLILAVVVGLFPENPLIPALVATGPIVELPLLSLFSSVVRPIKEDEGR